MSIYSQTRKQAGPCIHPSFFSSNGACSLLPSRLGFVGKSLQKRPKLPFVQIYAVWISQRRVRTFTNPLPRGNVLFSHSMYPYTLRNAADRTENRTFKPRYFRSMGMPSPLRGFKIKNYRWTVFVFFSV